MLFRRASIIGLLMLFLTVLLHGQGFRSRFKIQYALNNTARAVFEITPGNYIAAGFVSDTNTSRLAIMGLNSIGQPLWVKKYGNAKFQYLMNNFIRRSFYKQGAYIYHACCVKDSNNKQFGVLIKFALNGDTLWQKIYRDTIEDVIPQMVTGSVDGGFLITGFFQNWANNTRPALLIKTDINGNELWRKRLHKVTPNISDGKSILQDTASKKIVIAGFQNQGGPVNDENILILDSIGNIKDFTAFVPHGATIYDMIQTKDKNFVLTGMRYETTTLGGYYLRRSYVIKFDLSFPQTPIWNVIIDKPTLENTATNLRELSSGEILVGGAIDTLQILNRPTNVLMRFSKISTLGNITFNRYYDFKINDSLKDNNMGLSSFELCQDGGWVAAIQVVNTPNPNPFFFVKYDANGCDTLATHCATMNLVGIKSPEKDISDIKIYPNPFNDILSIDLFEDRFSENIELILFDVLGKEVLREKLMKNSTISTKQLDKGVYFLKVSNQDRIKYYQKIIKE